MPEGAPDSGTRERRIMGNLNTCHVWAADGPAVTAILDGQLPEAPEFARTRMEELGLADIGSSEPDPALFGYVLDRLLQNRPIGSPASKAS